MGPRAGLNYYLEFERLWRDLDYAWSQGELDPLIAKWRLPGPFDGRPYRDQVADGMGIVGIGIVAGRPERARGGMTSAVIQIVARSIAAHAGGMTWTEADRQAGGEHYDESAVRRYRKRLRDRLDPQLVPRDRQPARPARPESEV